MIERWYGRITVEGWFEDDIQRRWGQAWSARTGGTQLASFYSPTANMVEHLPEPITFNDGDVLRLQGVIWGRVDGYWWTVKQGSAFHLDGDMRRFLRDGLAVRLVPEGGRP